MLLKYTNSLTRLLTKYPKLFLRHSALFINGQKAVDTFVYVTPHIDVKKLKEIDAVKPELIKRKSDLNIENVKELWKFYNELKVKLNELEEQRAKISQELQDIVKSNPESEEVAKLNVQKELIRENIKKMKIPFWSAEENAVTKILKIPNNLHEKTPESISETIFSYLSQPSNSKDHLKVGMEQNLFFFKNNDSYYLKGDAAVFELSAKYYFSKLLRESKFIQFSNSDFVKSVIVEGCGLDHTDSDETFILHHEKDDSKGNKDLRLHLTGGASLCSFMAYYAKNVIYSKNLPLKLFTIGRQYTPSPLVGNSLFHVSQSSVTDLFIATKNSDSIDIVLEEITEVLKQFYTKLGYHFRICILPADKLKFWESLRISVEMYSSSLNNYVDVGNISVSGDFISKRLMFTFMDKKKHFYPHIISGTVFNVPKVIACILEQDTEGFAVPQEFSINNW